MLQVVGRSGTERPDESHDEHDVTMSTMTITEDSSIVPIVSVVIASRVVLFSL